MLKSGKVIGPGVRELLAAFKNYLEEMLKALSRPGLPLHNNDSERDIRRVAKFRDISGGTKNVKQTCYHFGENFWDYLRYWFLNEPINLAKCVSQRYRMATIAGPP